MDRGLVQVNRSRSRAARRCKISLRMMGRNGVCLSVRSAPSRAWISGVSTRPHNPSPDVPSLNVEWDDLRRVLQAARNPSPGFRSSSATRFLANAGILRNRLQRQSFVCRASPVKDTRRSSDQ